MSLINRQLKYIANNQLNMYEHINERLTQLKLEIKV